MSAIEFFPVVPYQTVWNEEEEEVDHHVVHERNDLRSEPSERFQIQIDRIAREDFFDVARNELVEVKSVFDRE